MKNVAILGSTGSIGLNTLDVIRDNRDKFRVVALSACRNIDLLESQAAEFAPSVVALHHRPSAAELERRLKQSSVKVVAGDEGNCFISSLSEIDLVVMAISGASGLVPALAAIRGGKDLALATKEVLVMAGNLIMKEAQNKAKVIPIDSEHNAIFQAMAGSKKEEVKRIILTASGGPLYGYDYQQLQSVSVKQALKHPNWEMGKKVTIDSATLMNKGLEVIAARWLFDLEAEDIKVLIHPQSIVHSMVEFFDGSVIAQLGLPDMRIPISYALHHPCRLPNSRPGLNLATVGTLTFEEPNLTKFSCLEYGYYALRVGGTMSTVLNAANETVVEAFLEQKLSFTKIHQVIKTVMDEHEVQETDSLDKVLAADKWARNEAALIIDRLQAGRLTEEPKSGRS